MDAGYKHHYLSKDADCKHHYLNMDAGCKHHYLTVDDGNVTQALPYYLKRQLVLKVTIPYTYTSIVI